MEKINNRILFSIMLGLMLFSVSFSQYYTDLIIPMPYQDDNTSYTIYIEPQVSSPSWKIKYSFSPECPDQSELVCGGGSNHYDLYCKMGNETDIVYLGDSYLDYCCGGSDIFGDFWISGSFTRDVQVGDVLSMEFGWYNNSANYPFDIKIKGFTSKYEPIETDTVQIYNFTTRVTGIFTSWIVDFDKLIRTILFIFFFIFLPIYLVYYLFTKGKNIVDNLRRIWRKK